jgi:hypothetical protein
MVKDLLRPLLPETLYPLGGLIVVDLRVVDLLVVDLLVVDLPTTTLQMTIARSGPQYFLDPEMVDITAIKQWVSLSTRRFLSTSYPLGTEVEKRC